MAAFRETLSDIERSNRRSADTLETMDERRAEREEQMAGVLASSRTWMLVALGLCIAMGTVAMTVSIITLVTAG